MVSYQLSPIIRRRCLLVSTSITVTVGLYTLKLEIISEFGADNVTVTVGWTQQVGVVYNTSILPLIPLICTENTSQLTIQYNAEYNLSVVAVTPCRNTTVAFIRLHYGELAECML